jgi:hypothetical protein
MTPQRTGLITLAALALAAPLRAAPVGRSAAQLDDLRTAQERVARAASATKGGAQQRLLLEHQELSGMIDNLERGRQVDPGEIDRAIQRAENPNL